MREIPDIAASFIKTGAPLIFISGALCFFVVFQLENIVGCTIIDNCKKKIFPHRCNKRSVRP
jgi:DeoR/GlpR family transcriptional regulator of sugar metabolism